MAKTDMERTGLFSELGYTNIGDPYKPNVNSKEFFMISTSSKRIFLKMINVNVQRYVRISEVSYIGSYYCYPLIIVKKYKTFPYRYWYHTHRVCDIKCCVPMIMDKAIS